MGIIKRQTIVGSILTYVGVVLGFISTAILQPLLLSPVYVGVLSMLQTYSNIASSLLDQGLVAATVRNFTYFENNKNRHHGYFMLLIIGFVVAMIITVILYLLFNEEIKVAGGGRSALLARYAIWLLPLTASLSLFNLMDAYLRGLKDAVSGTLYKEVIQRILLLIVYAGLYFSMINFDQFVAAYIVAFALPAIMVLIKVFSNKAHSFSLDLDFFKGAVRKDFLQVLFFGALLGVGGTLVRDIDRWMIKDILGLADTGVYSIAWYFGFVISVPGRALNRIAITVIADSWKNNRLDEIDVVYKASSVNQTIIGGILFLGLCLNLNLVFEILPPEYEKGRWTVIFIALSRLCDMATGANTSILSTSKDYRWGAYFLGILVVLVVLGNWLFIPEYGISGAALASAIALFAYNIMKMIFLYVRYNLNPLSKDLWLTCLLIAITGLVGYFVPTIGGVWVDFLVRSTIIVAVFVTGGWLLKIQADLLEKAKSMLKL